MIYKKIKYKYLVIILVLTSIPSANILTDNLSSTLNNASPFDPLRVSGSNTFGEFIVDTTISLIPTVYGQTRSSIAFDGTNYFVVWLDMRFHFSYSIFGARINRNGEVIDSGGIPISSFYSYKFFPSVTFGGSYFLVTWSDERNGDGNMDIYGARVTSGGDLLDPQGIPISTAIRDQFEPKAGFDGGNYFVVWWDRRAGGINGLDIYGSRVNQSGIVLDPDGIPISTAPNNQGGEAIGFDGMNYFVIWSDGRNSLNNVYDIYGARVTPQGVVLDTAGIPISTAINEQSCRGISFDGANYLAIWYDRRNFVDTLDVYGARITPSGMVLDTAGIFISRTSCYGVWSAAVAFDGTNYMVIWEDESDSTDPAYDGEIYGARVSTAGVVLDTAKIPLTEKIGLQFAPRLAFDGTNYLAVWDWWAYGGSFTDIFGKRINPSGVVIDTNEIMISTQASHQDYPAAAFDGTNYLVVWDDDRNSPYQDTIFKDVYGIRVSQAGTILDPGALRIAGGNYHQIFPSIAFDGTNYLVVYDSGVLGIYDIYGVRVSPSGVILDTSKIPICVNDFIQRYSALAFDGANYLTLWQDDRNGSSNFDIYGARITPQGTVLDPAGLVISTAVTNQQYPALVFGDTDYFAVWQDSRNGSINIYGTRISPTGRVWDAEGIILAPAGYNQNNPAVATNGMDYFVVWQENLGGPFDICGVRVTQTGMVLDTIPIIICSAPGNQESPTVAFDGTNYVVIWQDCRVGSYQEDLYGVKISPAGFIIDSFIVANQFNQQILPALIHGSGDQLLVAYSGWTDSINHHPANSMRIWGKLYPPYGIAEEGSITMPSSHVNIDLFPNPMKNTAYLHYNLIQDTQVKMAIYDVTGRLVKGIVNKQQKKGNYQTILDLSDLSEGVYFLYSDFNDNTVIKKLILIR